MRDRQAVHLPYNPFLLHQSQYSQSVSLKYTQDAISHCQGKALLNMIDQMEAHESLSCCSFQYKGQKIDVKF